MIITNGSSGPQRGITKGTTAMFSAAADLIPTAGTIMLNLDNGYMYKGDGVTTLSELTAVEVTSIVDIATVSTVIYGTEIVA